MIGKTVQHFHITAKIGEGGMGEVYLAADTQSERRVAIKFLALDRNKDDEDRKRFLHEGKALAMLDHPNITAFIDAGEFEGRAFIVMEYVDGRPLDAYVADVKPRLGESLDLLRQIAEGLAAAHERGVIHRDIKPQNILVDAQGHVKITDFGLARWRDATTLTRTGTQMGTAYYMSPEQVDGRRVDYRSDIFSLGVLAYELISSRRPFEGESTAAITYSVVWEAPHPLARYTANVPDELQTVIDKCLDKNPNKRYQSARELAADFERVARHLQDAPGMGGRAYRRRRGRKLAFAGGGLVAATVIVYAMMHFGVRIEPMQEAAAQDASLAVVHFANVADPGDTTRMAQMAATLLTSGLSESQYLRVTSRQRLHDLLSQTGKSDLRTIDRLTARDLAQKAGVRWMVTGEVMQISPRVVLSTEVTELGTGNLASAQTITGAPGDDIFALVDRMSKAIRTNLPLSDTAKNEELRGVAEVSTSSPEAYKCYLEGLDLSNKGYHEEAEKNLLKAVSIDSTFAMAYYELSRMFWADPRDLNDWMSRALRFSDHASWKEQKYIRARAYRFEKKPDSAVYTLRLLLERYPDEKDAHWVMGLSFSDMGMQDSMISRFERALVFDTLDKFVWGVLVLGYGQMGQYDKAMKAADKYIELAPDEADPYLTKADLYAQQGILDKAIELNLEALRIKPDFYGSLQQLGYCYMFAGDFARAESTFQAMAGHTDRERRSEGRARLASILIYRGQFRRARELIEAGIMADRLEGYDGQWACAKLMTLAEIAQVESNYDLALAELNKAQACNLAFNPTALNNNRTWEVELRVKLGDMEQARKIAEFLRNTFLERDTSRMHEYWMTMSYIDIAEGRYDDAITAIGRTPAIHAGFWVKYQLACAYLANGDFDRAIPILERSLNRYSSEQADDPVKSVRGHYLLATAYEQEGEVKKAAGEYQKYLEIMKDADAGIPEVEDARQRLAKLSS